MYFSQVSSASASMFSSSRGDRRSTACCAPPQPGTIPRKEACMSFELTEESLETVAKGEPFRFTASERDIEFVVLRADVYDRLKVLFTGDDIDPETVYPLLAEMSPEDWEDASVYGITPEP